MQTIVYSQSGGLIVEKIRTVSDAKRDFYRLHTRPINSVYRRVVEELLVEMHLLSVNVDFRYNGIYALGVVTSFEKFMEGYQPEGDRQGIFYALCQAVGGNGDQYRHDADILLKDAHQLSGTGFLEWIQHPQEGGPEFLRSIIHSIHDQPRFKYSRLFAIGLYTLITDTDATLVKEEEKRQKVLTGLAEALSLPADKMQKDLDLYRSNLDKMEQLLKVLEDTLAADRKKREQREQASTPPSEANAEAPQSTPS